MLFLILFMSVVFGYLQAFDVTSESSSFKPSPVIAMVLVLASATTSAIASLVTEKILKDNETPFHVKKVWLDAGSIVSSLVLLPVIGHVATRSQDIPWAMRPYDKDSCPLVSVCWNLSADGCSNPNCFCECTSGVFAGWNDYALLLAVIINTTQGWLVGRVTQ